MKINRRSFMAVCLASAMALTMTSCGWQKKASSESESSSASLLPADSSASSDEYTGDGFTVPDGAIALQDNDCYLSVMAPVGYSVDQEEGVTYTAYLSAGDAASGAPQDDFYQLELLCHEDTISFDTMMSSLTADPSQYTLASATPQQVALTNGSLLEYQYLNDVAAQGMVCLAYLPLGTESGLYIVRENASQTQEDMLSGIISIAQSTSFYDTNAAAQLPASTAVSADTGAAASATN